MPIGYKLTVLWEKEDFDLFMTLTSTFDLIDPKIQSNGPRIITNHPTEFDAIRFNTF